MPEVKIDKIDQDFWNDFNDQNALKLLEKIKKEENIDIKKITSTVSKKSKVEKVEKLEKTEKVEKTEELKKTEESKPKATKNPKTPVVKKTEAKKQVASSIRVSSDKLDSLVDMVGELVTVHARIKQTAEKRKDSELESVTEQLERLVNDMRDLSMNIRMMPIGPTFDRFKRLVRDLSEELGKKIKFETEGSETELDKTVIEKINEPLIHIIRNSLDHGVEEVQERINANKPEEGTVKISGKLLWSKCYN